MAAIKRDVVSTLQDTNRRDNFTRRGPGERCDKAIESYRKTGLMLR